MGNNSAIWWVLGIVVLVVLILIGISLAKRSRSKTGGSAPAGSSFPASGRSGDGPRDQGGSGTPGAGLGDRGEAGTPDADSGDRSRAGTAGVAAAGAGAAGVAGAAAYARRDDAPPEGETGGAQDRDPIDSRGDATGTATDDPAQVGAAESGPTGEAASDTSAEAARPYAAQPGSGDDPDRAFFGDDDDVRPVERSNAGTEDINEAPTQAIPVTNASGEGWAAPGADAGDGEEPPLYAATEDDRSEAPTQAIPTSEPPAASEGSAREDWVVEKSVVVEEPAVNDPQRQPGQNSPTTDEDGAATAQSDQGAGSREESRLGEESGYGGAALGTGDAPGGGGEGIEDTGSEESTRTTDPDPASASEPFAQQSAAERQADVQKESEIEQTAAAPDGVEPGLGREAAEVRSLDASGVANGDESTTAAVPSDVPEMPGDATETPTDATPPRAPVAGDPGDPAPSLDERAEELSGSDASDGSDGAEARQSPPEGANRDAGLANSIASDRPIGLADPTGAADPIGGADGAPASGASGAPATGVPAAAPPPPGTGAADPAWAGAQGPHSDGPGAGSAAAGGAGAGGAAAAAQRLRDQARERWSQPGKSGESPSDKLGHLREQAKERWSQPGKDGESPSGKFGHLRERVEGEVRTRMQNRPASAGPTDHNGPIQSGPTGQNAPGQSGGQSGSGLRGRVEGEVRHRVEDGIRRFRNRGGSSNSGQ